MTKDKTSGRSLSAILIFLFLFIILIPSLCFAAPGSDELKIEVKGGYADTAMVGSYTPFNVAVINKGDDLTCELQILVSTNQEGRSMYAMPVSLPKNSNKLLKMDVPVQTVNRKVEVRLAKGNKVLKSVEYQFKKVTSPETPVIGIISDDPGAFANVNGMKIIENVNATTNYDVAMKFGSAMTKAAVAYPSKDSRALPERPVELIYLDSKTLPDNVKAMNAFNVLVIGNFDTSSLSGKQVNAIDSWVRNGKALFLGTGPNWKKVYSGLGDNLKPFKIEETKAITTSEKLGDFTGIKEPLSNLVVSVGNPGNGKVILSDGGYTLAALYKNGSGAVTVLTFDPTLEPAAGWSGEQALWKKLISETYSYIGNSSNYDTGRYSYSMPPIQNMQGLASSVPETQTPPFAALLIIIGFYILIAGPALYIILKWRDKRDWNWVIIPITAFLFMGIIYIAGFKTRFTTAVTNNISIINLDNDAHTAKTNTIIGAFNNSMGTMRIRYDSSLNLDMDMSNLYYNNGFNPGQSDVNKRIINKQIFDSVNTFELYEVPIWQPRFITTEKNESIKGSVIESVAFSGDKVSIKIKNPTRYAFKDSFIAFGNNFVNAGNILPGEEKVVNTEFGDSSIQKKLNEFLDKIYDQKYMYGNNNIKRPDDWHERSRKRDIITSFLQSAYLNSMDYSRFMFCALSYDDPGYAFEINGKKPKSYNMNVIYSNFYNTFTKGQKIEIPSGIIKPVVMLPSTGNPTYDSFSDGLDQGVRVFADGDIDFLAKVPDSISVDRFKVEFASFLPSYVRYQPQSNKTSKHPAYAKNIYKYFLYNNKTAKWDEIGQAYEAEAVNSPYFNDKDEVKIRVNAVIGKNGPQEEFLGLPDIGISGVIK